MRLDPDTPFWVVTDPTAVSDLGDILFQTDLKGLRLQFAGGLEMDANPTIFTDEEEADEEGKNRLAIWKIARQIRQERGLPLDEVVRVTLHDEEGKIIWQGEVR